MSAPQIAIVGAGPSGLYLADALGRKLPTAMIDIFDRLPTPFGLVRGGVAPDHQGTKNISRQFERTLAKPGVGFHGNVEVGRDVSADELRASHDVIVLATGALEDRHLGIPGEHLDRVYGSGAFVGWYNGIPDHRDLGPRLDATAVAIIGNGNVALDIARLFAKSPGELAGADLCAHARDAFASGSVGDIYIIGRRGPADASFTSAELAEFGELELAAPVIAAADIPDRLPEGLADEAAKVAERNLGILRGFAAADTQANAETRPRRVHFLFHARPLAIHGHDQVEAIELESRSGKGKFMLPVGVVITAIGYRSRALPGFPFDAENGRFPNQDGRVAPGVYAAGWCRRGPQGVVPANRADALGVAELIASDLATSPPAESRPGMAAILPLLAARGVRRVDFAGWQKINAAEVAAGAADGRPREKLTRIEALLGAAGVATA